MYFKLQYNPRMSERFEARSEKEAVYKAKRKIQREEEVENPQLYFFGPGEYEVWSGGMWFDGEPTHEQYHEGRTLRGCGD